MTHELMLFVAAFATVFSLGFQQQNVVHGHYLAAFLTSFIIGGSQIVLWRFVPDASASQIAATLAGGPLGITASMVVHRRFMGRRQIGKGAEAPLRGRRDTVQAVRQMWGHW